MAVAGMLVGVSVVRTEASSPTEYEVKAAYLYNFGRFVEWPQDAAPALANDFAICVLGRDPFGKALDTTITGEQIDGKSVVARRISRVEDAAGCRELFISPSEQGQLKGDLSTLEKLSVLTVSDMPEFVECGGMVQFVLSGARVRFEINLAAAHHAGLSLSAELLKVAAEVRQGPTPED